jgi:hypothetical protein
MYEYWNSLEKAAPERASRILLAIGLAPAVVALMIALYIS